MLDLFCPLCYRQYNKLRTLLKDARHDCVLFANEFQQHCYLPREKGEAMEKWQTRCESSHNILHFDLFYFFICGSLEFLYAKPEYGSSYSRTVVNPEVSVFQMCYLNT